MAPEKSEIGFSIIAHSKDLQNQCSGCFAVILNEILVFVGFTFEFFVELDIVAVSCSERAWQD